MKIKLAILCPIRRKIAPGGEGKLENKIFTLAQELVKLGVDVTLLAAAGSQSPGSMVAITPDPLGDEPGQQMADLEAMALCEAFAHAGQFDVIHNFFGAAAFPFSIITTTPMISFLDNDPAPAHSAIYMAFSRHMRFVAEAASPGEYILKSSNMEQSDFFGRITVVRQGSAEQIAREYLEVYRQILSKRENYRPWGHYENLAEGEDHKIKRIVVAPGARLSLQKHEKRSERWVVISGHALVTLDDREIPLAPGDTVFIPKGAAHRVKNPEAVPLVFAEVQLGDYFGEDDIVRLQDDYGR